MTKVWHCESLVVVEKIICDKEISEACKATSTFHRDMNREPCRYRLAFNHACPLMGLTHRKGGKGGRKSKSADSKNKISISSPLDVLL